MSFYKFKVETNYIKFLSLLFIYLTYSWLTLRFLLSKSLGIIYYMLVSSILINLSIITLFSFYS
jgi:hypothetical protein